MSSCTSCEGAPARAAHGEATKTSTEPATEMASKHGPPVSVGGAKSLKPGTQLWMQVRVSRSIWLIRLELLRLRLRGCSAPCAPR